MDSKKRPFRSTYFSSFYTFTDSIERVFEVYRNPSILEKCQEEFKVSIQSKRSKKDFLDTIGATFIYNINNQILYELMIEDSVDEENYKMIQACSLKVTPFDCHYRMKLSFYWSTLTHQTILFEEIWFIHFQERTFYAFLFQSYNPQMQLRCKVVENYLKKSTFLLSQLESVLIETEFNEVCRSVIDWKRFVKLSPEVSDKVILQGDPSKLDSIIILIHKNEKSYLKVIKNEENNGKRNYELVYNSLTDHKKSGPKQLLKFNMVKISETITFLSFVHEFLEPIDYTAIIKMQSKKKKILSDLKLNLENKG